MRTVASARPRTSGRSTYLFCTAQPASVTGTCCYSGEQRTATLKVPQRADQHIFSTFARFILPSAVVCCRVEPSKCVHTVSANNSSYNAYSSSQLQRNDSAAKMQRQVNSTQPPSVASSPEHDNIKAPVAALPDAPPVAHNGVHREQHSSPAQRERSEPCSTSLSPQRSRASVAQSHITYATHASCESANTPADGAHAGEDGEDAWEMQNAQDLDPQAFLRNLVEQPAEAATAEAEEMAGAVDGNDEDEYHRTMQQVRRSRNVIVLLRCLFMYNKCCFSAWLEYSAVSVQHRWHCVHELIGLYITGLESQIIG